mmetsp:Transcript_2300/g.6802  ORF Transcript_2300/g.6802 Transcript_2300/m.6802 type:complete len:875 (+) Transcript_2300:113-2737(+)
MAVGSRTLLAIVAAGLFGPLPTLGNWLLQCSSCVDQTYFSDDKIKENVKDAPLEILLAQLKQIRLREFDHREDEFYNKFFSKRQLGIMAHELQPIMPSAVANVPERRWTNAKGVSNMTKNVMLLRDSHVLMATIGSVQLLARKADHWDFTIEKLDKDMSGVLEEQNHSRVKREEMLDHIVRTVAKVEVMQHAFVKTEQGFVRLEEDVQQFKKFQDAKRVELETGLDGVRGDVVTQNTRIADFQRDFKEAVEREARADLVEKRKAVEGEVEVQLIKRSIEKLKWGEEQNTIRLREQEKRESEAMGSKLHQERVAHELAKKKEADLALMHEQEASNIRQEEARVTGEKELLVLRLASDERRAEMGVQEAIEKAKIEEEAKLKAARDNEDVNLRAMKAEQKEKRQQVLAAIRASAEIAANWVASIYGSPQNLMMAIGSVVLCLGGVYLAREMAVLLREQLNRRLGRPSLVRTTNRRGRFQEVWLWVLRKLRLAPPHGAEFSDVVLHPHLMKQVMRLAEATRSAKSRRMPLQHAMFYGPPGTGKTMVAQRFAEYSGLEYAIMCGGDVAPLEEQAVTELHKLFQWVHRSRRGVLLFIDEADSFLASRSNGQMSETLRNALTTILYHTGTPTSQFMLVIATNRPGDLDSAVLDRLDEAVEFGLPDIDARKGMVSLYFQKYITQPLGIAPLKPNGVAKNGVKNGVGAKAAAATAAVKPEDSVDEEALAEAARRLHSFSGREIAKLFTSLQTHVLYSGKGNANSTVMPRSLLFEVIDQKVEEHARTADFQVKGYDYQLDFMKPPTPMSHTSIGKPPTPSGMIGRRPLSRQVSNGEAGGEETEHVGRMIDMPPRGMGPLSTPPRAGQGQGKVSPPIQSPANAA